MEELMVINPSPRRRRTGGRRKHRSAAQRRATAKLVALNRSRKRHSNPRRRARSHAVARRRSVHVNPRNPIRRARRYKTSGRFRSGGSGIYRYYTNPRRRRRRNPSMRGMFGDLGGQLMGAATGAAGAIGVDLAMTNLPLPAMLKTGRIRYLTAGAGAILLGMIAGLAGFRRIGTDLARGSLTVTLRDAIKEVAAASGFNLGYYSAAPVFSYPTPGGQNLRGAGGMGRLGVFMPSTSTAAREREARQMGEIGVYFHR